MAKPFDAALACVALFFAISQSVVETIKLDATPKEKVATENESADNADATSKKKNATENESTDNADEELDKPILKVVKKSGIEVEALDECHCGLGEFWHPAKQACVEQGGEGFDCTDLPKSMWPIACTDGLKCKADDSVSFCRDCNPNDHCQWGQDRHKQYCMKSYKLTGEACATIKATVPSTVVKVSLTKSVTVKAVASKEVPAKATEKEAVQVSDVVPEVKGTAGAGVKVTGEATAKVTATYKQEVEKTATARRTASGESNGSSTVTSCAKLTDIPGGKTANATLAASASSEAMEVAVREAAEEALRRAKKIAYSAAKSKAIEKASEEAAAAAEEEATSKAREAATEAVQKGAAEYAEEKASEKAESKAAKVAKSAAKEIAEEYVGLKELNGQEAAKEKVDVKVKSEPEAAAGELTRNGEEDATKDEVTELARKLDIYTQKAKLRKQA